MGFPSLSRNPGGGGWYGSLLHAPAHSSSVAHEIARALFRAGRSARVRARARHETSR
jgi:hypothetical protein